MGIELTNKKVLKLNNSDELILENFGEEYDISACNLIFKVLFLQDNNKYEVNVFVEKEKVQNGYVVNINNLWNYRIINPFKLVDEEGVLYGRVSTNITNIMDNSNLKNTEKIIEVAKYFGYNGIVGEVSNLKLGGEKIEIED